MLHYNLNNLIVNDGLKQEKEIYLQWDDKNTICPLRQPTCSL